MANSISSDKFSMLLTSLVQELRDDLSHPIGLLQIGFIGVTYLIAWLFAKEINKYLEKGIVKVKAHTRFVLSPFHFAIILRFLIWMLLLWFCRALFLKFAIPADFLPTALNLIVALLIIRLASLYIRSKFWSRFVYVVCAIFVFLRIFKLWGSTVELLDSMTIGLGKISVSVWGLTEAITVFILLWAAAGAANRFIAQWLTNYSNLTYSDRTLLQRVVKAAMMTVVILISLRAAGIPMTTIAVTGGAIGFAVGIGLQKIGSNLVAGLMLLLRKPIRQGDVVAFEKSFAGARWGWIEDFGVMYVKVATRDGALMLLPNEVFVTQKIANLSFDNDNVRLHIPFGISYDSDLKKATTLAETAAMSIDRVLKIPQPKCLLSEFGDSTVNLELRVWISDPKNGFGSVKDTVLSAVWDSFHANGIEIAFPQRDLHIKDAVPLRIIKDNPHPVTKDSLEGSDNKGKEAD